MRLCDVPGGCPVTGLARRSWPLVIGVTLALSAWSLFTMVRGFGAPTWLALCASAVFDGVAIILADQAHRSRLEGDSAVADRLAVALMIAVSAWLNWHHAYASGWTEAGAVFFAGCPISAELLFELKMRHVHRAHLRAAGRVTPALVPLGRWAWLVFPSRAWSVVRAQISGRLDAIEAAAQRGELAYVVAIPGTVTTPAAPVLAAFPEPMTSARPRLAAVAPAPVAGDLSGVFRLTPVTAAPVEAPAPSGVDELQDVTEVQATADDEPEPTEATSAGLAGREAAVLLFRGSLAAGSPMTSRQLAATTGLSQTTAARVIKSVRAEVEGAAA